MKSLYDYIFEGGAAGHMAHPYDYTDFTLRDLKGLIRNLFSGKVEDITEKIDGVNIVATMNNDGEVVFIRNKSDLNSAQGGMTIEDMSNKWANKPEVAQTFLSAGEILTKALNIVGKNFFNPDENTRIAVNCECVIAGKTNVIPYTSSQVDVHNLFIYKKNGETWEHADTNRNGIDKIQKACEEVDNIQLTPQVIIKTTKDSEKVLVDFIKELDKIFKEAGCKESSTIDQYKRARFNEWCRNNATWVFKTAAGVGGKNLLYARWFNNDKSAVNIKQLRQLYNHQFDNEIDELDKKTYKEMVRWCMEPLDTFFGKLGNAIIKLCDGFINAGFESDVIEQLRNDIEDVVNDIQANGSVEINNNLTHQLNRLAKLGNEINPTEGIVFRYKGKLQKLTGSFSSINAVLGSIKFSKR